jgi:hypothetical protein
MLLNEFYTVTNEVAKTAAERETAAIKFRKIYDPWKNSWEKKNTPPSEEQIKALVDLSKISGRNYKPYLNSITIGNCVDYITRVYRRLQISSGTMPTFSSTSPATAKDMAERIAEQTNGSYTSKYGRVWTSSRGGRYRDPQDHIRYKNKEDLDSAWEWCLQRGKQVHYYDSLRTLQTAIRIGRFLVKQASTWSQQFGDDYLLSVRTVRALQNPLMNVQKITDQQASALRDLAQTRNANALEKIKLLMNILKTKDEQPNLLNIKTAIDTAPQIDPRDKAKLDKIIDDAKNLPPEQLDEAWNDWKSKVGAAALAAGVGLGGAAYKYYQQPDTTAPAITAQQEVDKLQKQYPEKKTADEFATKLAQVARQLQVSPQDLYKVMWFETKGTLDPSKTNRIGATGLIQFMPKTAEFLGTTTQALRNMSAVDQLDWVLKYYKVKKLPPGSKASDIYLITLFPAVVRRSLPDDHILAVNPYSKNPKLKKLAASRILSDVAISRASMWTQNPVFRQKNKDFYTVGDVRKVFDSRNIPAIQ